MTEKSKWADLKVRTISAVVMVVGIFIVLYLLPKYAFYALLLCAEVILLIEWVKLTRMRSYKWLWFIFGFIYITPAMLGLAMAYLLLSPNSVAALIFVVAMIDMGGYFAGKYFGKRKIWPSISPGKTWEGAFGSFIFCVIAMIIVRMALGKMPDSLPIENIIALSLILVSLTLGGDLFESALKRRAGVKDSGKLIPGHGGLFDRVDGLLAAAWFLGGFAVLVFFMFSMMGK
ncbi:MAG: phosphatidate cytidylyltransferase [Rickettsiales bacterium]